MNVFASPAYAKGAAAVAGRSYRNRAQLFFSAVLLLVLVAMSITFYRSNRSFLLDYIGEINTKQAQAYARQLDAVFFRASYASAVIADRSRVQRYVAGAEEATVELENGIVELLQLFARANREMSAITVYSAASGRVVTDRLAAEAASTHDLGWLPHLRAVASMGPELVYREDPVFGTPMISLVRRIDDGGRLAGGIVLNLETEDLRELLGRGRGEEDYHLYVVQAGDRVVFSTADADLGAAPPRADERLFLAHASGTLFNLDYYLSSGSALFDEKMAELRRYLVILLVTVLLIGSGLSALLAGFAYRPIREIVETIEHPDLEGDAGRSTESGESSGDEIRFIEDSILRMMASNRQLEARLAERFQSLSRAHYATLQLQINPHFLYNTLESIYWNCLEVFDATDPVPSSVLSLSRFLRMVIATDAMAIPLCEEVDIAEQYLRLLRLRYEDQLTVRWQIPDDLRGVNVPRLVLQPLLENAFYHGIKPLRRPGTVTVRALTIGEHMELRVSDDGIGIAARRTEEIRRSLAGDIDLTADHIGLLNVTQRLRILYGDESSVEIESAEHAGTTVRLTIPESLPKRDLDKLAPPM